MNGQAGNTEDETRALEAGTQLGPYSISRKLGAGGMGVVYEAWDARLERAVALKILNKSSLDAAAEKRLLREGRMAAAINHPSICQLYDIGEDRGQVFLVMELLEGESLTERISRGPTELASAVQMTLGILTSLDAFHRKGLVHRDLKPSNIFLTQHGIKLLDFGLSRSVIPVVDEEATAITQLTQLSHQGDLAGTPQYMAPEQLQGKEPDHRADLFATGAVLFEMLTGRKAFSGRNAIEVFHAILHEQPPALTGSAAISAVDLIVRRALAKKPDERYNSAQSMSDDLRTAMMLEDTGNPAQARAMTRLIVLPFRMLRPDPEIDFLTFSLPDAITNSLFGLTSLVVRSSVAASKYAGPAPDLKQIAAEAEVDIVLTGALLRSGEQLRVSAQLAEAASGTVIWSQTSQMNLKEIFQLQDEIVQRVVQSLELPLTARENRLLRHDVPANATAYEFYLRANQLATDWGQTFTARDLYLDCVGRDPNYAPAWARLGRCYRVLAKYGGDDDDFSRAESAFRRSLELNADLTLAHNLFAGLEADLGRAESAMLRLLERARTNRSDPNLFSGLVYACRFCGLLDASVAAHQHACRLDPHIPTSVTQSYFMSGDFRLALETSGGDFGYMEALALASLGREREALDLLRNREQRPAQHPLIRFFLSSLRALLEGKSQESLAMSEQGIAAIRRGGEELFYFVRQLSYLGETERAVFELERAIEQGFFCHAALLRDPWLNALRPDSRFINILSKAKSRHEAARNMFVEAGGMQILGAA